MRLKIIIGVLIICLAGLTMVSCLHDGKDPVKSKAKTQVTDISLLCVGDIMAHEPQYRSAYDADTDTYDFESNYAYVRDYISSADIAMCNVETVFGGGAPSGYPMFNAPDELAVNLKNVGFDVALTSNNHMLDQGSDGVLRSIQIMQAAGLKTVGSQQTEDEPDYIIVKSKGIKVGIVSYTFETTGASGTKSINAINVPEKIDSRICSFNPENWESETLKIQDTIQQARDAGAEIIVCYLHWGNEYEGEPCDYQINMAGKLAGESGADVIFASHPHVLQKAEILWSDKFQKNVPVYYSMGNFVSNQRQETLGKSAVEEGMIAEVVFDVTKEDGKITRIEMTEANALLTWMNRHQKGGSWAYDVVPLDNNYENCLSLTQSDNVSRAEKAFREASDIVGSQYRKDELGRVVVFSANDWLEENTDGKGHLLNPEGTGDNGGKVKAEKKKSKSDK